MPVARPARLPFPVEEKVPESLLHTELRILLWRLLQHHFGHLGTAGTDQFVYWDETDPRKNLAPDVYFSCRPQPFPITSWKCWERGVPELAIEIVSDADSSARARDKTLERYTALGVRELVRFDRRGRDTVLEAWDIADGVAQRRLVDDRLVTPCHTLGGSFVVRDLAPLGRTLRLASDEAGLALLPSETERANTADARIVELLALLAAATRPTERLPSRGGAKQAHPSGRGTTPAPHLRDEERHEVVRAPRRDREPHHGDERQGPMTATLIPRRADQLGAGRPMDTLSVPRKAGAKVLPGTIVVANAGYAAAGTTATGLVAMGLARATVDNTTGADGAVRVLVRAGIFKFLNLGADPVVPGGVFSDRFIADNQTVAATNGGSTRSRASKVIQLDADGVFVQLAPGL